MAWESARTRPGRPAKALDCATLRFRCLPLLAIPLPAARRCGASIGCHLAPCGRHTHPNRALHMSMIVHLIALRQERTRKRSATGEKIRRRRGPGRDRIRCSSGPRRSCCAESPKCSRICARRQSLPLATYRSIARYASQPRSFAALIAPHAARPSSWPVRRTRSTPRAPGCSSAAPARSAIDSSTRSVSSSSPGAISATTPPVPARLVARDDP